MTSIEPFGVEVRSEKKVLVVEPSAKTWCCPVAGSTFQTCVENDAVKSPGASTMARARGADAIQQMAAEITARHRRLPDREREADA